MKKYSIIAKIAIVGVAVSAGMIGYSIGYESAVKKLGGARR